MCVCVHTHTYINIHRDAVIASQAAALQRTQDIHASTTHIRQKGEMKQFLVGKCNGAPFCLYLRLYLSAFGHQTAHPKTF